LSYRRRYWTCCPTSAIAGLVSCFARESAGERIAVWTELDLTVSVPPVHANTTLPRLVTVGGGGAVLTRAWNVTAPVVPALIDPRLTTTTPLPRATTRPASPSAA